MPTVQEALQRHKAVLNENLELWKFIDANGGLDESTKRIVSQGYQDTLAMITAWAELETTLSTPKKSKSSKQGSKRLSTDQDSAPTPKSKRRRVNGEHGDTQGSAAASTETVPVVDASGLFMIDPNPTNVDTLLGQNQGSAAPESQKKKKKRRRSEQQDDDDHQSQPGVAEPKSRSKRRRSDSAGKSSERAEPNVEDPDSFKNNSRQDQDTHHEAFEAKVALRLKEKEDQRKKKVQKKRKRSSEASTAADDDIASDDDEPKKTRKPRAKKAKSVNAAGIETGSRRRKRSRS